MILDACARLMVGKGVLSLTMHGIAKEAGTSIGSLYHFFRDKEEVLSALGRRHIDALGMLRSTCCAAAASRNLHGTQRYLLKTT
ncbi:helix-turn-helix domain-containing protein [Pseudomonas lundensis]|uniref:helix-turn-helix domain-containing protein n=1 Tax=Pseudomonas lundensis TaxID=86185 RepID=UPI000A5750C1|nr:TetR/AcrR family transcriptional regulator [Pseudomonas lundensis]